MAWAKAFGEPEFEPNSPLSWTRGEYVGAGSYGKVYKCHLRNNNHILAVKIVQLEPQTQKEVEALNNEIRIFKKFRHERIVSYYGNEQKDDQLHLFMEFMAGGSLSGQIKRDGVLSEHLSKRYTKQMLEGVCFLHSQDIIHRDIKDPFHPFVPMDSIFAAPILSNLYLLESGANVLLDSKGNVKLADFGLSKMIEKVGSKTNLATSCGSPYWMAPEIIWGNGYGRKADIWSLGCTVVEMLTGKPPLGDLNPHAAMFRIGSKLLNLTLPESVSNEAKRFIEAALTWEPDNRPWSHALQSYAFISNRNEMEERSLDLEAASDASDEESDDESDDKSDDESDEEPDFVFINGMEESLLHLEVAFYSSDEEPLESVKTDRPTWDELEELSIEMGTGWKTLGRCLGIEDAVLYEIDLVNEELSEKAYQLLRRWLAQEGSDATYQALYDALQHELVGRPDLAEKYCTGW